MEEEEGLSSLSFKGSITEAIIEAKRLKKLFVVYISGDDQESDKLNKSTWTNSSVAESVSKYCVLLHIQAGSVDATNFSAIYPYSSVPCISAIGFSGTQVWKNEGFIGAEELGSSLEKAWFGLHIQDTISAALASQNSEKQQPASSASNVVLPSEAIASPSTVSSVQPSERDSMATSVSTKEDNDGTAAVKKQGKESGESTDNQHASSINGTKAHIEQEVEETPSRVHEAKKLVLHVAPKSNDDTSTILSSTDRKRKQGNNSSSVVSQRDIDLSKSIIKPKDEGGEEENVESSRISTDVHLNIRLPYGSSLQEKFSVTTTLSMVKDYVNTNKTIPLDAYDLAVPYPRKVYSDQDLDKSLSELGLFGRQALIVVPRKKATVDQRGASDSEANNVNNGGYFAFVRRVMSYANPFSYFGGGGTANTSSSALEPQSGMWDYGVNPEVRNSMGQVGRGFQDPLEGSRSNVRNRRPTTTSRIGSNIHTLKHDEEDAPFGDGNAFWNGNSTQYGGGGGGEDGNDRR